MEHREGARLNFNTFFACTSCYKCVYPQNRGNYMGLSFPQPPRLAYGLNILVIASATTFKKL